MPFGRFSHAIVRPPAATFADGLTTAALGAPDVALALRQHEAYCRALERHGLALTRLPADPAHPDSTFVEDTALVLPGRGALVTRPGAPSRAGEVHAVRAALAAHFDAVAAIEPPGTLDAGDVAEAEHVALVGLSHRTNAEGARQLAAWLAPFGIETRTVDVRAVPGILHLKSGVVALDPDVLLAIPALAASPAFDGFRVLVVPPDEAYAANAVRVNDVVIVADGHPATHALLRDAGYALEAVEMSEFRKMDGGLTCLSLRF